MSTTVTVRFKELLQDRQELAVDDEYMVSTVYFDVLIGDKTWPDQTVDIKQTAGASFESDLGALEVIGEAQHEGPRNYQGFRDCVEDYFRSLVGRGGSGIRVGPGSSQIRMTNNRFVKAAECSYEAG
jgi:hypothetical protein